LGSENLTPATSASDTSDGAQNFVLGRFWCWDCGDCCSYLHGGFYGALFAKNYIGQI